MTEVIRTTTQEVMDEYRPVLAPGSPDAEVEQRLIQEQPREQLEDMSGLWVMDDSYANGDITLEELMGEAGSASNMQLWTEEHVQTVEQLRE